VRTVVAVSLLLFASVALPQPLPSMALPAQFDRVLRDYEKAWAAKDAAALAQLFTEDGFVLSNGKPPVRGRDAIRLAYAESGGPLFLRALAYSADGSVANIIGAYSRSKDEPDIGKFVLALKKGRDGRWRITADIDNANARSRPAVESPLPTAGSSPRGEGCSAPARCSFLTLTT
jgi:ketosteroid isomerase-like protein